MKPEIMYRKHENLVDKIYNDLKKRRYDFQLIGRHVNYGCTYNKVIGEIDLVQYSHLSNDRYYFILHEVKGTYKGRKKALKQLSRAYQYMMRTHKNKNIRVFCFLETGKMNDLEGRVYNIEWIKNNHLKKK